MVGQVEDQVGVETQLELCFASFVPQHRVVFTSRKRSLSLIFAKSSAAKPCAHRREIFF